jgi:hypothetical protein
MPADRRPTRTPDDSEEATRARRRRALEEPLEYSVLETDPVVIARVRNPLHGTQYRLYLPAYPRLDLALCTCPDFARRGLGTCKHLEGAARWIADHPRLEPVPRPALERPRDLWSRIDRRREALRPGQLSGAALRRVGAVLWEETGSRRGRPVR